MNVKYKISETPLRLREYGRNVQAMVEYCKQLEDHEERTKLAHEIVRIMTNLNPQLKEYPDYKQKLWDHIFVIADFDLDVDSPFPKPTREQLMRRPAKRIEYQEGKPRYRQYGWNVEYMINQAAEMPEGKEKSEYLNIIANTMKQFLRNMDRESMPENTIAEHIREISNGKIRIKGEDITLNAAPPSPPKHQQRQSNGQSSRRHRSSRGRRRKGN